MADCGRGGRKLNVLPDNPESGDPQAAVKPGRFPSWLHRTLPEGGTIAKTSGILNSERLHTVCEEAKCPNLWECFSKGTATFLIMGKACTRGCGFCSIDFAKSPKPLEEDEPLRVSNSVGALGLKHVVLTMVARDDLADGGAQHLARVVQQLRRDFPAITIEVLTSDFEGNEGSWDVVLAAQPDIFNHNIETIRELTPRVRHKATYARTLGLLQYAAQHSKGIFIKSGLMVGLGETEEQVQETIVDLHQAGCHIITIGQYLQPTRQQLLVKRFVHPEEFKRYEAYGLSLGVSYMYCGPFVRSSYNAGLVVQKAAGSIQTINSH